MGVAGASHPFVPALLLPRVSSEPGTSARETRSRGGIREARSTVLRARGPLTEGRGRPHCLAGWGRSVWRCARAQVGAGRSQVSKRAPSRCKGGRRSSPLGGNQCLVGGATPPLPPRRCQRTGRAGPSGRGQGPTGAGLGPGLGSPGPSGHQGLGVGSASRSPGGGACRPQGPASLRGAGVPSPSRAPRAAPRPARPPGTHSRSGRCRCRMAQKARPSRKELLRLRMSTPR